MDKENKNKLKKVCDEIIEEREKYWDDPCCLGKEFLDENDYLKTVKEKFGDDEAEFFFVQEEEEINSNAIRKVCYPNINNFTKEVLIVETYFVTVDGYYEGKVIMIR